MESKNSFNTFVGYASFIILLLVGGGLALFFMLKQFAPKILATVMGTKL